jgi:uncharacterized membrane protein SirB2
MASKGRLQKFISPIDRAGCKLIHTIFVEVSRNVYDFGVLVVLPCEREIMQQKRKSLSILEPNTVDCMLFSQGITLLRFFLQTNLHQTVTQAKT